jgi:hypothetical protein
MHPSHIHALQGAGLKGWTRLGMLMLGLKLKESGWLFLIMRFKKKNKDNCLPRRLTS